MCYCVIWWDNGVVGVSSVRFIEMYMNVSDIQPAPLLPTPIPPNNDWEKERRSFNAMLPDLLKTHRDRVVAIHNGQVVESGTDIVSVGMRAYARVCYVPIYVDLVTDQPRVAVRIPSPRVSEIC